MADVQTQRSLADLYSLLPDNHQRRLSPQDVRDVVETLRPNIGELYASAPGTVSVLDTAVWYDAAATFALGALSENFDLTATGRLRYTGTAPRKVCAEAAISYSVAGTNQQVHLRLALTGVEVDGSEQHRVLQVNGDIGFAAAQGVATMANGDYLTVQVRNSTATNNVTFEHINLKATAHVT